MIFNVPLVSQIQITAKHVVIVPIGKEHLTVNVIKECLIIKELVKIVFILVKLVHL